MMDQMGETMPKGVVMPGDTYTYTFQVKKRERLVSDENLLIPLW